MTLPIEILQDAVCAGMKSFTKMHTCLHKKHTMNIGVHNRRQTRLHELECSASTKATPSNIRTSSLRAGALDTCIQEDVGKSRTFDAGAAENLLRRVYINVPRLVVAALH